eukprot:6203743-Pleurochrysis_carterae.AAC.2
MCKFCSLHQSTNKKQFPHPEARLTPGTSMANKAPDARSVVAPEFRVRSAGNFNDKERNLLMRGAR